MIPVARPGTSIQITQCARCDGALYARQPMRIVQCAGSCEPCQPGIGCAAHILEALHVGCWRLENLAGSLLL